ncbi:hypothetical protein BJ138DRAFT_1164363 [Hygrophoropsis aurantiaca]|uniref:Uncharacterized protein n=1 Tax=Hygrophoropsis aurantiaca TaxID=72124 RepID=A0ACB7ZXN9_9AGAM|nr:hypothetical protein BJ138DRAFT_1164363 [Hygrophoropsis aurantiaca]
MESTLELYDRLIPYRALLWIFNVHLYQLDLFGVSHDIDSDLNMYMAVTRAETIFLLTMQAILVIRVYALFNQSKKVLIFPTTFYVLQAITVFVMTALLFNDKVIPEYMTSISPAFGSVAQILTFNPPEFFLAVAHDSTIVSVVFDTVLLLLALWAFVRHALEAKASDGRWSINVLVRTLVADHLVYFVCNLIWLSLSLASGYVTAANTEWLDGALYVFNALVVVAGPRMVISLRAMENKTRGEGETVEVELSAIRVGIRELSTQSESVMEEGDF